MGLKSNLGFYVYARIAPLWDPMGFFEGSPLNPSASRFNICFKTLILKKKNDFKPIILYPELNLNHQLKRTLTESISQTVAYER